VSERPLRVCLLAGRYPPDFTGWGIQIERLLPHLARRGVEIRVVTRRPARGVAWPTQDTGHVERILAAPGERLARLRSCARLHAHLRRHHRAYDAVHGALADWEFYANLPFLARVGVPALHEMVLLGADDPVSIGAERGGRLKLRWLQHVRLWVGISEVFRSRVEAAGIPEERFRCIHPGIDVDRYRPATPDQRRALRARLGIASEARVVISMGALLPRKGMDRLLRAWACCAPERGRDLLLLVGPATEREGLRPWYLPHVRELETLAGSPELAGTVRMVGRVDDPESWLAASDAFALLSRSEGFGIVIAEAMGCGLPCLVSPLEGIGREIVNEGTTGFVVDDPDDPEAVAGRLRLLLSDAEVGRKLGAEAAKDAHARFSLEARASKLEQAYRDLVATREAGR
jgi:glycosyltransferase involved in cell wall biosynthesis